MLYNTASYGRKIKYIEKRGSFMRTKKRNNKMMHNTLIMEIDRMNGYLGFTRVHGETRYNDAKNAEIADRKSM